MPVGWIGQEITFASEIDPDENYSKYVWIPTKRNDTIRKIAARRGHPEWASEILKLNKGRDVLPHPKRKPHQKRPPVPKLRSITQTLRFNVKIRLPGQMTTQDSFSVHAGDSAPQITGGYAKYSTVDIPGRLGLTHFDGYDPITIVVPIQFENYAAQEGVTIEQYIKRLERMAGRGSYPGNADGPPAVIRISVTDNHGNIVPLIPPPYQWSSRNTNAPLWRISDIAWDANPLRNDSGYRVRQAATVTLQQYTPLIFVQRSVAKRSKPHHHHHTNG